MRLDGQAEGEWTFADLLDGASYARDGAGLDADGLYVALDPYGAHLFRIERQ